MKKVVVILLVLVLLCGCLAGVASCKKSKRGDDVIYIRNLYFSNWNGGDAYTRMIEEKYGVTFETASYDFSNWMSQVQGDLIGDLPDVFEANIDSYNFNNTYINWADGGRIQALPDEVFNENGRWKHLAKMLNGVSDIQYMKHNGKLYGIPVVRNVAESDVPFSPFTYVYRRDIAKQLHVDQPNDVYTWAQFKDLLVAFKGYFTNGNALGDSEWGFPSILNYYKTAPHCFAITESGTVVNNYWTDEYQKGLKLLIEDGWKNYYLGKQPDYASKQNKVKEEYTSGNIGIFYENLSMANYTKLRSEMVGDKSKIDDKTAIMKVIGPDGNYALEGQEQWFSMTLINSEVSENKLNTILDIMDWLLSEEGTNLALYGVKDSDYQIVNGEVKLLEDGLWEKDAYTGEFTNSENGAKYLRYMVTLGNDLVDKDPFVQMVPEKKKAYDLLSEWSAEMMTAYRAYQSGDTEKTGLRVLVEDPRIKWLQTENKLDLSSDLLEAANAAVMKCVFKKGYTFNDYKNEMTNSSWKTVLDEINANWKK